MEDLQTRLHKLEKTSEYTFKSNTVKSILEDFKKQISMQDAFNKAVEIDKKRQPVYIKHEKIMSIIDEFINMEKFSLKFTPNNIIDGYGNIAVSYNGDPYLTLRLLLMALRTHNNIVFFSKNFYAINTKMVETMNMIAQKKEYAKKVAIVEYDVINGAIAQNQHFFNLLIYIGDKREYQTLKKKIAIPTIFNGYGNVDVFIENKEFKDVLLDINRFANENNITVNFYDNTLLEDTLEFINKYELTDCFVLLSKNTEMIYKFISEIKSKNIFINKTPFENYKLTINESDLVYSKNIVMN